MVRRGSETSNREPGNLLSDRGELPMKAEPEYSPGREGISLYARLLVKIGVLYEEPATFIAQVLLILYRISAASADQDPAVRRRGEIIWYHLSEQARETRSF